ncbi:MAG: 30S ribosomal protein S18 [bacterium]|nr:30S ribosomal protein S18 [bacterium]
MKNRKYIKRKPPPCRPCKEAIEVDYKNVSFLRQYLTPRGRMLSREKTGFCAYHQRRFAEAVKRARIVALLPFVALPE